MKKTRNILILAMLVILAFAGDPAWAKTTELGKATIEKAQDGFILQLDLSAFTTIDYGANTLPANPSAGVGQRYYVDLYPLVMSPGFQFPKLENDPNVKQIRWSQYEKEKVRIVFDLISNGPSVQFYIQKSTTGIMIGTSSAIKNPEQKTTAAAVEPVTPEPTPVQVQIPVETKPEPEVAVNIPKETPKKEKSAAKETAVKVTGTKQEKIRIILDAGHGGDDPGARGKKGTLEKDVTLAVTKRLRELLSKNDKYEIFMTRDKDTTLQLLDRTKFANQMKGDLFVSIHANASPKRTSKGVSTYFLNNADDQESLRVAMRENGELDPDAMKNVSGNSDEYYLEVMKASMVKNFHTAQSTDLARAVQTDMLRSLRKNYSDVVDLGVRSARFYVLTGATMPAILVETSFISNLEEERRLSNSKYQDNLARAILNGVEAFLKNRPAFESTHHSASISDVRMHTKHN
jgi:N-acetylmuramoyl-L-alanine amidase